MRLFILKLSVILYCTLLATCGPIQVSAQGKDSLRTRCLIFSGFAGFSSPGGDLAKDYGNYGELGGGILYQAKSKVLIGLDFSYFFGNAVKNDPVPNLRDPNGNIIGVDGSYAVFKVFQRAFQFPMIKAGKTFSLTANPKKNILGGITAMAGAGWFQHWTYIQDLSKKTPQFSGDYIDGYNRMASGPSFGAWIGYLYLPASGNINFHVEAGYFQAFTKSRRFDFSTATPAGGNRVDSMLQLRLRICFTVRSRPEETFYYY